MNALNYDGVKQPYMNAFNYDGVKQPLIFSVLLCHTVQSPQRLVVINDAIVAIVDVVKILKNMDATSRRPAKFLLLLLP